MSQNSEEKQVLPRFDRLLTRMAERNAVHDEEEVMADVEAKIHPPETET